MLPRKTNKFLNIKNIGCFNPVVHKVCCLKSEININGPALYINFFDASKPSLFMCRCDANQTIVFTKYYSDM